MIRSIELIVVFFFLAISSLSAQSPWLPSKGGYFFQLSYSNIPEYSRLFNLEYEDFQTPRFAVDNTIQFYGEYGISDKFSLLVSIPYKMLQSRDINPKYFNDVNDIPEAATVNAMGNVQLSMKYNLLQSTWVSALQLKVELPANASKGEPSGLYPGYDAYAFIPSASIGRGWNRFYFYYYLSVIARTNNFDEKLDTGIEGGWLAFKNFWLIAHFNIIKSFNNTSKTPWPSEKQYGLYTARQEYTAYGLKFIYEISLKNDQKIGFIAQAAGSTWGFMVAKSPYLGLGVYLKK